MSLKLVNELDDFETYKTKQSMTPHNKIPLSQIKLETDEWKCVENVACVFIDLENSTKFATNPTQTNLQFFAWYGDTTIKIFKKYGAKYIDFQGDGGFALFDNDNPADIAFYVATTINHFFNAKTKLNIWVRVGIDIGDVVVKKVGIRGENKEI